MSATKPAKLLPLTSLRFIAALMIVLHHGRDEFQTIGNAVAGIPLAGGVSFFFILSGFILAYSYPQIPSLSSAVDFWVTRFARIWPLHIATLAIVLYVINSNTSGGTFGTTGAFASNVLLLQAWLSDFRYIFSYNAVSWSISVEAFFYAMFPLLIYRIEQTWPLKLLLCAVIVVLVCLLYQEQANAGNFPATRIPSWALIQFNPLARLLEFMLGITACVLWRRYLQKIQLSRAIWTVIEVVLIAAAIFAWMQLRDVPVHLLGDFARGWWYLAGMFIIPATLTILLMATSRGVISKMLSYRPCVFLGEISFSLYMIHQLVLRWYQGDRSVFAGYSSDAVMVWYIVTSLVAAAVLWAVVEKPCMRTILAFYRKNSAVRTPQVAPSLSEQSA